MTKNPPAFPRDCASFSHNQSGMTLRDWFAGQALTGLAWRYDENAHYDDVAGDAYKLADAMLAERTRLTDTDLAKHSADHARFNRGEGR